MLSRKCIVFGVVTFFTAFLLLVFVLTKKNSSSSCQNDRICLRLCYENKESYNNDFIKPIMKESLLLKKFKTHLENSSDFEVLYGKPNCFWRMKDKGEKFNIKTVRIKKFRKTKLINLFLFKVWLD